MLTAPKKNTSQVRARIAGRCKAPPKLIIPFHTSGIIPLGTSTRQNRSHLVSRMMRAASSRSRGWETSEW